MGVGRTQAQGCRAGCFCCVAGGWCMRRRPLVSLPQPPAARRPPPALFSPPPGPACSAFGFMFDQAAFVASHRRKARVAAFLQQFRASQARRAAAEAQGPGAAAVRLLLRKRACPPALPPPALSPAPDQPALAPAPGHRLPPPRRRCWRCLSPSGCAWRPRALPPTTPLSTRRAPRGRPWGQRRWLLDALGALLR